MNLVYPALRWERLALNCLGLFAFFCVASISLQNVIYLGLLAWFIMLVMRKQPFWISTPLNWPLVILAGVLVLASLAEGSFNSSIFGLRKVGLILIFFFTVAQVRQSLKADRFLNVFLIGAISCGVWSLIAHLAGWDGGRARSFSGDYMAGGGMYMLAWILTVPRILDSRGTIRWFWGTGSLILLSALLFTYTRSSWIGALAALIWLGIFRDWRLPVLALMALVLLLVFAPQNSISNRIFSVFSRYHSSNVERKYMWDSGWKLIRDRPGQGYGIDNLSKYYSRYVHPEAEEQSPPHVHNTLMQLALNGGVLASGCYLWWVAAIIIFGFRIWKKYRSLAPGQAGIALGLSAAGLGFFVNGWFEFNFGTAQLIGIFYFLTGLLPAYAESPGLRLEPRDKRQLRVLCQRPRFRGDVLMTSVVPRLIKRDFPRARVDLLTEPEAVMIAVGEPAWDRIISLPRHDLRSWWRTVRHIRAQAYDVVCDLFGNPRTAWLAAISGASLKIGPAIKIWGLLFDIRTQPDRPGKRPAGEAFLDILRVLGLKQLSLRPRWEILKEDAQWVEQLLQERGLNHARLIGMFAGGSHPAKRWPLKNFFEIAKQAKQQWRLKFVFVFGPQEEALQDEYLKMGGKKLWCVAGLTPGRLAALWARCEVVISNDAFPMHLGPAVNIPTIGLFGPGEPEIWFPYSAKQGHRSLRMAVDCWPCHQDDCGNTLCWEKLTPLLLMGTLREILKLK